MCCDLCSEVQAVVHTHRHFQTHGKLWLEVVETEIHEHLTAELSVYCWDPAFQLIAHQRHPAVTV